MKVRQLIDKLKHFDEELDVLCYSEDGSLLPPKHTFRLFEINDVNNVEGEKLRGDDLVPSLKIGHSGLSEGHVIIDITADF